MLWLNYAQTIYIGLSRPHLTRTLNILELVNEYLIMIIFFHLSFFTNWVPDPEMQFLLGWSLSVFVIVLISLNLTVVIKHGLYSLYLVLTYLKLRVK